MLGESIQTAAGDPSKAGESIRVVGTNPFIMGSEGEEGNRFQELIDDLDVECYLLNTGQVGERDVGVDESVTLLREVARGRIEWQFDEAVGLTVPAWVPGLEIDEYDVSTVVDDHERKLADMRAERRAYLASFTDLRDEIVDAVY
jgi:phosphoenolpyruvate carboxykinase (ATP)